jgi:hypothetical protein
MHASWLSLAQQRLANIIAGFDHFSRSSTSRIFLAIRRFGQAHWLQYDYAWVLAISTARALATITSAL